MKLSNRDSYRSCSAYCKLSLHVFLFPLICTALIYMSVCVWCAYAIVFMFANNLFRLLPFLICYHILSQILRYSYCVHFDMIFHLHLALPHFIIFIFSPFFTLFLHFLISLRSWYTKTCWWSVWLLVRVRVHALRPATLSLWKCWSFWERLPCRFHCWRVGSNERMVLYINGYFYLFV